MKNIYKNKLFGITLVAVIVLSLAACGGTGSTTEKTEKLETDDEFHVPESIKLAIVNTEGKLTITGLEAYEKVQATVGREKFVSPYLGNRFDISAFAEAYNTVQPVYYRNSNVPVPGAVRLGVVTGGKLVLKVYKRVDVNSCLYNYDSTETVVLDVRFWTSDNKDLEIVHGTVNVKFINGIGEGVFVPKY